MMEKNQTLKFAFYEYENKIVHLGYLDDVVYYLGFVNKVWTRSETSAFSDSIFLQVREYFKGKRKSFDFKYKLEGTNFQLKVWKALLEIPYGETKSYLDIAKAIGSPKAFRAVGNANNKNKISIFIPCHRVVSSNKKLSGYAGGVEYKQFLLDVEKIQMDNTKSKIIKK